MRISIQFQVRKSLLPKRTGPCKIKKHSWILISWLSAIFWLPWTSQSELQVKTTVLTSIAQILGYHEVLTHWVQGTKVSLYTVHYNFIQISTYLVSWTIFFFNCFMSLFSCEISLSLLSSIEFNSSFCFSSCAWMLFKIQMF